ncbi:hypothetical protein MPL1032_180385 [Mesorhizobium plurifarium]|uniref:Uncharacterized protein n=1 Tax=Mesorhizobium plurifarium TaxID=69974 RepID=A0A0K2VV66_MESPL|nr:hypothetical protein MPL1032_180385 [Mesorhizobium plurifarium]
MQAPTLPAGSPPASLHIARFPSRTGHFFKMWRHSGEAGLQTAASSASGAHVLKYAPLRFSDPTVFDSA